MEGDDDAADGIPEQSTTSHVSGLEEGTGKEVVLVKGTSRGSAVDCSIDCYDDQTMEVHVDNTTEVDADNATEVHADNTTEVDAADNTTEVDANDTAEVDNDRAKEFHLPLKKFKCPSCPPPRNHFTGRGLHIHLVRHHEVKVIFYCKICAVNFTSMRDFGPHLKLHMVQETLCPITEALNFHPTSTTESASNPTSIIESSSVGSPTSPTSPTSNNYDDNDDENLYFPTNESSRPQDSLPPSVQPPPQIHSAISDTEDFKLKCGLCTLILTKREHAEAHAKSHSLRILAHPKCPGCSLQFLTVSQYFAHDCKPHPNLSIHNYNNVCFQCNAEFSSASARLKHEKRLPKHKLFSFTTLESSEDPGHALKIWTRQRVPADLALTTPRIHLQPIDELQPHLRTRRTGSFVSGRVSDVNQEVSQPRRSSRISRTAPPPKLDIFNAAPSSPESVDKDPLDLTDYFSSLNNNQSAPDNDISDSESVYEPPSPASASDSGNPPFSVNSKVDIKSDLTIVDPRKSQSTSARNTTRSSDAAQGTKSPAALRDFFQSLPIPQAPPWHLLQMATNKCGKKRERPSRRRNRATTTITDRFRVGKSNVYKVPSKSLENPGGDPADEQRTFEPPNSSYFNVSGWDSGSDSDVQIIPSSESVRAPNILNRRKCEGPRLSETIGTDFRPKKSRRNPVLEPTSTPELEPTTSSGSSDRGIDLVSEKSSDAQAPTGDFSESIPMPKIPSRQRRRKSSKGDRDWRQEREKCDATDFIQSSDDPDVRAAIQKQILASKQLSERIQELYCPPPPRRSSTNGMSEPEPDPPEPLRRKYRKRQDDAGTKSSSATPAPGVIPVAYVYASTRRRKEKNIAKQRAAGTNSLGHLSMVQVVLKTPEDVPPNSGLRPFKLEGHFAASSLRYRANPVEDEKVVDVTNKRFTCPLCCGAYKTECGLTRHYVLTHPVRSICDHCGKELPKFLELAEHIQTHTERKDYYVCEICGVGYKTRTLYARHKLGHPENEEVLCSNCGLQFVSKEKLAEHTERSHRPPRRVRNNKERVVCEICGKLVLRRGYRTHKERHLGKLYKCDQCDKAYGSLPELRFHENTHLGVLPFKCAFCAYRFANQNYINFHMVSKHLGPEGFTEGEEATGQEKPFICDQCGLGWTTASALKEHQQFHGERTLACKECPEKFYTNYHRYAHRQYQHKIPHWSAGGKNLNLECKSCGKVYTTKSDYKYHMRTHSEDFAFKCEVCGKGTHSKGNLNAHMRKHGGAFQCPSCDRRFVKFPQMSQHSKEEHGKELSRWEWKTGRKPVPIIKVLNVLTKLQGNDEGGDGGGGDAPRVESPAAAGDSSAGLENGEAIFEGPSGSVEIS